MKALEDLRQIPRVISAAELKSILEEHEKWVKSEGMRGTRADLRHVDLRKADLRYSNLREANIRGAILDKADLRNANLIRADLRSANLVFADLGDANIGYANLCGASLREANLRGANLNGATLKWTNLRNANLKYTDLSGANLIEADLIRADLRNAYLNEADLREANLSEANLTDADLSASNLIDADFTKANLNWTDLRGANLSGADLSEVNLEYTKYFVPSVCPTEGSFIGWKKAITVDHYPIIIKLLIPEDALRSSGTSRKCRASKARVLDIQTLEGVLTNAETAYSWYDKRFVYEIGKTVKSYGFDKNRFKECSNGIHFFMDRQEAVGYEF